MKVPNPFYIPPKPTDYDRTYSLGSYPEGYVSVICPSCGRSIIMDRRWKEWHCGCDQTAATTSREQNVQVESLKAEPAKAREPWPADAPRVGRVEDGSWLLRWPKCCGSQPYSVHEIKSGLGYKWLDFEPSGVTWITPPPTEPTDVERAKRANKLEDALIRHAQAWSDYDALGGGAGPTSPERIEASGRIESTAYELRLLGRELLRDRKTMDPLPLGY